ncbi:hypothetical protein MHI43_09900 [Paenibacillus sp. FSL H8-0457]|uniref:hypothetical protein n=1 Tax=unclassified Paenibacillus TaxID=185978 RepID=UPI0003E1BC1E|nr:hypothetical protein [Paenibacillus sp. FSL H8-457]ETT57173.1 hypothetical protein C172_29768 [Paenibacillus sp. FSL H8-457]
MSPKYSSDLTHQQRPWLQSAREKRATRTFNLGKKSIDLLVSEFADVTYSNIASKSKAIDPDGKGIHQNAIRTNTKLYEYYKEYSETYKKFKNVRRKRETQLDLSKIEFSKLKLDRDLKAVHTRYKKMTKAQLIDRLIHAEQFIAKTQSEWLIKQFELFPKTNI